MVVRDILTVGVDGFDIPAFVNRRPVNIRHTELFALINVGGSLHHMEAGREHLCGQDPEFGRVIAEAGNCAGLVVVVPVQAVPCFSFQFELPFIQDLAERREHGLFICPFAVERLYAGRGVRVFKLENHVQLGLLRVGVFLRLFHGDAGRLADGQQVVL